MDLRRGKVASPKPRETAPSIRRSVGEWLLWAASEIPRGGLTYLALLLEVTVKALALWRVAAEEPEPSVRGRPPHPPDIRRAVVCRVACLVHQKGSRVTCRSAAGDPALKDKPRRLVNRYVQPVKRRRELLRKQRIEANRQHVEILAKNVMVGLDGTQLTRDEDGSPVVAETARDVGTRETAAAEVGMPKTGDDVVAVLEKLRAERGVLPLVVSTDGGPENVNEKVQAYLETNQVVHLRNVPRTPQHNPHAERANGELKRALELPLQQDLPFDPIAARIEWQKRADEARSYLNDSLVRPVLGNRTASDYARALPSWYTLVSRDVFHAETRRRMAYAARGTENTRDRTMAERRAVFDSLALFGLAIITRGDPSRRTSKQEEIS